MKAVLYIKSPDVAELDVLENVHSISNARTRYRQITEAKNWCGTPGEIHVKGQPVRHITLEASGITVRMAANDSKRRAA